MRDEGDSAEASEPISGMPDAANVASRAEGRPPEEQTSEDPAAQAEAVLQNPRTVLHKVQMAQSRSLNR
jgi:hypothetical protein